MAKALDRLAGRLPDITSDESGDQQVVPPEASLEVRRADALVALASAEIASDQDPDRATVVIHAELAQLEGDGGCELEGGGVLHAETVRRLLCDARIEQVLHDAKGQAIGIGRASRHPSPWLLRQLRYRDRSCTFPGCGRRYLLQAHHIKHWKPDLGPTDLDNLVLVCRFHHKLVHEYRWRVELTSEGTTDWFRPDGSLLDRAPPKMS